MRGRCGDIYNIAVSVSRATGGNHKALRPTVANHRAQSSGGDSAAGFGFLLSHRGLSQLPLNLVTLVHRGDSSSSVGHSSLAEGPRDPHHTGLPTPVPLPVEKTSNFR